MPQLPPASATLALAEAKAYLRIHQAEDDNLLTRLIDAAYAQCERYTGRSLIAREASEIIPASSEWRRLTQTPIAAITSVLVLSLDDDPAPLPVGSYAIDIDSHGSGWVRVGEASHPTSSHFRRVRVDFIAGNAEDWGDIAEPLRQGMIRLIAHLFANRDDTAEDALPGIVAALWRPWRRMRLT